MKNLVKLFKYLIDAHIIGAYEVEKARKIQVAESEVVGAYEQR